MKLAVLVPMTALLAAAQGTLPPYSRHELPNGAVLLLLNRSDVPLVTLLALVKGGVESDPGDAAGLASVTAELLRRGAGERSADRFSADLDFIGASFQTSVDNQSTSVESEFLTKDFDRALELFSDALLRPAFPEGEAAKVLAQRIDAARSVKDNPSSAIFSYFRSFFFPPSHPYGRPASGDELSLARLNRDQIAGYHKRTYAGKNLILVAAGNLPDGAEAKLRKVFGAAPAGTPYEWTKAAAPARPGKPRLTIIDKPDATQTYFLIAQPGIHRTHPDRIPLLLVNTLFGGRFTSMLNDELRVNSGLTYGAGSRLEQSRLPGALTISSFTRTETTAQAIDLALEVLSRLREKGLTADQLASAKTYLKGTYPPDNLETADQLASILGELELFQLDRKEVDEFFGRIDAVTLDQANAAARTHYRTENLQFLLLGNAAKIREAAAKYAPKFSVTAITEPGLRVPPEK